MIYEFKSRATGNLVMTQAAAERLLEIIGKAGGSKGIITVDQMPLAIANIEAAVAKEKEIAAQNRTSGPSMEQQDDPTKQVSLAQRAFPLLDMLKRALSSGKDITWGV